MTDWARSYDSDRRPSSPTGYGAGVNEMRGTDIIAEYLVKERVPYILGYAGHGAIGLLDGVLFGNNREARGVVQAALPTYGGRQHLLQHRTASGRRIDRRMGAIPLRMALPHRR